MFRKAIDDGVAYAGLGVRPRGPPPFIRPHTESAKDASASVDENRDFGRATDDGVAYAGLGVRPRGPPPFIRPHTEDEKRKPYVAKRERALPLGHASSERHGSVDASDGFDQNSDELAAFSRESFVRYGRRMPGP